MKSRAEFRWIAAGVAGAIAGWLAHSLSASTVAPSVAVVPVAMPVPGAAPIADPARATAIPPRAPAIAQPPRSCEEDLRRTRAELEKRLSLGERFGRGEPNPEAEKRLAPEIDRLLKGKSAGYTFECRGGACKLHVIERPADRDDWWGPLQEDRRFTAMISGAEFHAGLPNKDPVSGEELLESDTFVGVPDPDVTSGLEVIETVLRAFKTSGEVERCGRRFPAAAGELVSRVFLQEGKGFEITSGGALAMTPAGNCIDAALRQAFDRARLPPRYSSAVTGGRYNLP